MRIYRNSRFAGEMLVAEELARLGFEVMLGNIGSHNTKSFDMTAVCSESGHAAGISVKSLKSRNAFLIGPESILCEAVYVFVITGPAGSLPELFVVYGTVMLENEMEFFGKYGREYKTKHGRGIAYKKLAQYKDKWAALEPSSVTAEQLHTSIVTAA